MRYEKSLATGDDFAITLMFNIVKKIKSLLQSHFRRNEKFVCYARTEYEYIFKRLNNLSVFSLFSLTFYESQTFHLFLCLNAEFRRTSVPCGNHRKVLCPTELTRKLPWTNICFHWLREAEMQSTTLAYSVKYEKHLVVSIKVLISLSN